MKNQPAPIADLPRQGFAPRVPSLKKIMASLPEVVCVLDAEGCFHYVSAASERLWGYTPEEMVGRPVFDFLLPEDVIKTRQALLSRAPGEAFCRCENRFCRPDGTGVPLQWSGRWDEGLFYGVVHESCDPRQVEARLNNAQQLARLASYEFDLAQQRYTHASDTLFDICGLDRAVHPEFTSELFWRLVHPDDRAMVEEALQLCHIDRATLDYRILRPDGEVVYVSRHRVVVRDAGGRPLKAVGTIQDITALKKAELAAAQSGQWFKALVENSSSLIAIVDMRGVYRFVADSVRHLMGYSADELVGQNALQFIHPADHPKVVAALASVTSREFITAEPFRFRVSSGEWRWIEARVANFLDDPLIGGLVVNSHDVSDRKQQEDQIRRLSLIAEQVHSAILLTDERHRITWANKAFTELSGYRLEEVTGKLLQEIFSSHEMGGEAHRQMQLALSAGLTVHRESVFYSKGGQRYWLDLQVQVVQNERGEPLQYLSIGKDITERKEMEQALALSEQKYRALVRHGSDIVVVMDINGVFQYGSDNVTTLLGYEQEVLQGRNAFEFIHPEDVARVQAEIGRVLEGNREATGVVHRFRNSRGEWVWLESKGINHLANPAIGGILVNARDITERIELQRKLQEEQCHRQRDITAAVIRAQETERTQLGRELHDNVNQVLTTVKLYNEMYLTGYVADKELLRKAAGYVQDCINEIRSISKRLSAPTLGDLAVSDSLCELVASINLTNRVTVTFRPGGLEGLRLCEDTHLALYRIVQEALNNVLKYAGAHTATVELEASGTQLRLTITDDGKGFDTGAKRAGIGLSNIKTRAESLGGSFALWSKPGIGCRLRVELPLVGES